MCSMVVCVLLPRFELSVAAGGRAELARGPLALAPEPGREPLIGETSAAAEALGVKAGLRLGEALARCPSLRLVAPDPAGVADEWDRMLAALEGIGAEVESERAGVACFDAGGLLNLHGGLDGVLTVTRRALRGAPARLGVAPSRFAAVAAASKARPRRAEVTPGARPPFGRVGRGQRGRSGGFDGGPSGGLAGGIGSGSSGGGRRGREALAAYLAPLPIALLGSRPETAALPEPLERFGIRTLGELAALPRAALADRFGAAGPLARDLARGRDTPLVPRRPAERLEEALELPESGSGAQLEHALNLLIDRLVARRERRGRTFRTVVLSAALVEGGTWRLRMTFRDAHADPRRMRLAPARGGARPAGRAPALADRRARGGARRAAARGGAPGARRGGAGRRAEDRP